MEQVQHRLNDHTAADAADSTDGRGQKTDKKKDHINHVLFVPDPDQDFHIPAWMINHILKRSRCIFHIDNMRNKTLDYTALTLVIIGAVNWGLIGFFDFNLVASLFGGMSWLSRIIYGLVGLCGLYLISFYMQNENARS